MYIKDEMKVNRFKDIRIPSKAEYMKRFGLADQMQGNFTGDEPYREAGNKTEVLAELQEWDNKNVPPTVNAIPED